MSEKISPTNPEKQSQHELLDTHSEVTAHKPEKSKKHESEVIHEHKKNINEIRSHIDKEISAEKSNPKEKLNELEKAKDDRSKYVGKDLIEQSYKRTLTRTRKQLSPSMRGLSKVAHSPMIESVSEIASKTVARPSGVLAGGIFAFLGSSVVLWIARHYGYEYNFLLFALLFIGGFFVGLIVELLVKMLTLRKSKRKV